MIHPVHCTCDLCLLDRMRASNQVDRQAGWDVWYQRDHQKIQRYVAKRCQVMHCGEHCDDIVQDTFVIAFRKVAEGQYQDQGKSLCSYLYGIARNLVYEVARFNRRNVANDDLLVQMQSNAPTLIESVVLEQVLTAIVESRGELAPVQQQILDGLYARGETSEQVGTTLKKSANNVRTIALRAIREIEQRLQQHYRLTVPTEAIRLGLQMVA